MEDKKKLQTEKRKKTAGTKEGKSVRTRRLRSANEKTNAAREKNSIIIDGDRSVK